MESWTVHYTALQVWLALYVNDNALIFLHVNMCFLLFVTGTSWEAEWLLKLFSYVFKCHLHNYSETIKPMHAYTKRHLLGSELRRGNICPSSNTRWRGLLISILCFITGFWGMLFLNTSLTLNAVLMTTITSNTLSCYTMKIRLLWFLPSVIFMALTKTDFNSGWSNIRWHNYWLFLECYFIISEGTIHLDRLVPALSSHS